jgi:hypothetical protein
MSFISKVTILYNKSNTFGLKQDSILLQRILESQGFQVRVADPLEPQGPCDIAIHLEVPVYAAACLAAYNVFVINPEWWEEAWNSYLPRADLLIFKCEADRERFLSMYQITNASLTIPWTTPVNVFPKVQGQNNFILWLLGGSVSKREAGAKVIPLWNASWPELRVYTTSPLDVNAPPNSKIHVTDLTAEQIRRLQAESPCHMIMSASESLGLSALEGQAAGAFLIGNALPVYQELFLQNPAVALIDSTLVPNKAGVKDTFENLFLHTAINQYLNSDRSATYKTQIEAAKQRSNNFAVAFANVFRPLKGSLFQGLRPLQDAELPHISVVTLLYNRRKFVDLAIHNLLVTDYPKDKIEWVVVEDSDITEEQAADKVLKFGRESAPLSVSYIPMPSTHKIKNTIGAKRNLGIQRAQHDIILFMDDDDHYPDSSFRRRVSTLLTHSWKPQAAACTTIACYDLIKGTSAVNTPPWGLPLKQRISEATLVFYKSWWAEKGFPDTNVAEGEGFLDGRECEVVELPPQQIIVAMSHAQNSTSRRIPPGPSGKPSCFWGFPKEFLKWLHGLVDVEIE